MMDQWARLLHILHHPYHPWVLASSALEVHLYFSFSNGVNMPIHHIASSKLSHVCDVQFCLSILGSAIHCHYSNVMVVAFSQKVHKSGTFVAWWCSLSDIEHNRNLHLANLPTKLFLSEMKHMQNGNQTSTETTICFFIKGNIAASRWL